MRLRLKQAAVFCATMTFLSQNSFANVSASENLDSANESQLGPIAAVVRLENGHPVCVQFADEVQINYSKLQLPLCPTEGEIGPQTRTAFNLAQKGGAQTAFLSYPAVAVLGCVYGATSTMMGASLESALKSDSKATMLGFAGGAAGGGVLAYSLAAPMAFATLADPTGHIAFAAAGYVICAGGINYLAYREMHLRN